MVTVFTAGTGAPAGAALVSFAIGGATAGAVSGASYAYANGGDAGQVLRGAAFGALSGAVGGAVGGAVFGSLGGGFVGYTLSGAAGGSAAGFIEGFAATGTWNGAFQGALYGGIAGAGFGIVAYGAVRGIGYIGGVRSANTTVRTTAQLVQDIATRAEAWGIRTGLAPNGPVSGTLKHGYADRLLTRYQRIFGDRGLSTEVRYLNGTVWRPGMPLKGTVRLDVVEGPLASPSAVFDYKFGAAQLTPTRIGQIRAGARLGPNYRITEVHP